MCHQARCQEGSLHCAATLVRQFAGLHLICAGAAEGRGGAGRPAGPVLQVLLVSATAQSMTGVSFRAAAVLVMDETGSVGLDLSFSGAVFLMEPLADAALEEQVMHFCGALFGYELCPVRLAILILPAIVHSALMVVAEGVFEARITIIVTGHCACAPHGRRSQTANPSGDAGHEGEIWS